MPLPVEDPEEALDAIAGFRLLARLARLAEQVCGGTGISLPQYRLLISISGKPQRASELAEAVGVSRPTLTSLVAGLERNGLLRRAAVPDDRRGIRLEATRAGEEAVGRAEQALAARLSQLVEPEAAAWVGQVVRSVSAALDREDAVKAG